MNIIEFGDNRETLKRWAEQGVKVQMCVTSPPYYNLRDYKTGTWVGGDPNCDHVEHVAAHGGERADRDQSSQVFQYKDKCEKCGAIREDKQLGQEETPEEFIENMVDVFRHVRNILADDGVIWVNMGDTYARQGGTNSKPRHWDGRERDVGNDMRFKNLASDIGHKPKDLLGIPWMLAFALRADGWYLRQDIIWSKLNPMPESVRDRCTKSHEYIFLLSKSQNYFFDHEAIKEPLAEASVGRAKRKQKLMDESGVGTLGKQIVDGVDTTHAYAGLALGRNGKTGYDLESGLRNKRSVWTVATKPYKGAHFATYPPELIEPCILSSTSERGHCSECGARWVRDVERKRLKRSELNPSDPRYRPNSYDGEYADINGKGDAGYTFTKTIGWKPTCDHGHEPVPDIVLDPFMGSGTTAAVAIEHGRQYMGCDLNPDYQSLQNQRISAANVVAEEKSKERAKDQIMNALFETEEDNDIFETVETENTDE